MVEPKFQLVGSIEGGLLPVILPRTDSTACLISVAGAVSIRRARSKLA